MRAWGSFAKTEKYGPWPLRSRKAKPKLKHQVCPACNLECASMATLAKHVWDMHERKIEVPAQLSPLSMIGPVSYTRVFRCFCDQTFHDLRFLVKHFKQVKDIRVHYLSALMGVL